MPLNFEQVSDISYTIAFVFCLSCNFLLLYLVYTKSPSHVGNYKYLMTFFACNGILHSSFDFYAKPIFLMLKENGRHASYLVYFVLNKRFPDKNWAVLATEIYGFFLAVIFVIFAVHFVFRYWTITKNEKIRFFNFPYFIGWIIFSYWFGVEYSLILHIEFSETPDRTEIIRQELEGEFGYSMDEITYMAARFMKYSDDGKLVIDWRQMLYYFAAVKTMIVSLMVLAYCGVSIAKTIRSDLSVLASKERFRLEMNLLTALVVQTIIPIIVIYAPFLLMWTFPHVGSIETARITGMGIALYPGIDPLAVILIVANYRRAVLRPFKKLLNVQSVASVSVVAVQNFSNSKSNSKTVNN